MTHTHIKQLQNIETIDQLPGRAADRAEYYMRKFGCDEAQAIEWAIAWYHNMITQKARRAEHKTGFDYPYQISRYF